MKKYSLFFIIILFALPVEASTVASCSAATAANAANITSNQWASQSFTTVNDGNSYDLTEVTASLQREANNTAGTYYAKLYTHSGVYGTSGVPTGAALATSAGKAYSDINTGSYQNITFTFSDAYTMSPNASYIFTIETSDANGDGLRFGATNTTTDCNGNAAYYNPSTWTALGTYDGTPFTITGEIDAGGGSGGSATSTTATSTDTYSQSQINLFGGVLLWLVGFFWMVWLIRKH